VGSVGPEKTKETNIVKIGQLEVEIVGVGVKLVPPVVHVILGPGHE